MANEPLKTAVVTDIGKAKLDAAYQAGKKVIIREMALGDSNLVYVEPKPAFTKLVNELGRQALNEGNTTSSWINALVYVDSQRFAGKSILEFGLYDDEGDLIVYSSYTPSVVPDVGQDYIQIEIECSIDLYNASAVTIEVTPVYPQATELERGIAKVATDEDVGNGTDNEKFVTPKKLKAFKESIKFSLNTNIITFTSSKTYTPSANAIAAEVIIVGGGGGGAGSSFIDMIGGGGGAGGGTAMVYLSKTELQETPVIVGAGGAGGKGGIGPESYPGPGEAGGDSSFGAVAATGGSGGPVGSSSGNGALNGGVGNGEINIAGGGATYGSERASGQGGGSYLSGGAPSASKENGHHGLGPGAGGSGASADQQTARDGGKGHDGVVIIKEYLNA